MSCLQACDVPQVKGSPEHKPLSENTFVIQIFLCEYSVQDQCQVLGTRRWEMRDSWVLRTSVGDIRTESKYVSEELLSCSETAQDRKEFCLENWGCCHQGHGIWGRPQRTMSHASKNVQRLFCQRESQPIMCTFGKCVSGSWGRPDRWNHFHL